MHLLHVQDLKVEEFSDDRDLPPYAILSHTWGDGEVSFQDIKTPEAKLMAGYSKISQCCNIARLNGFDYVWIDTCCIDKTSSSELTEAINSMFRWYETACICYAFLSDVEGHDTYHESGSQFRRSRWFTRGWTLQELLAPEIVVFFNQDWTSIGTKGTLANIVSQITGISAQTLRADSESTIKDLSIAERMSWASNRQTTRVEDIAYCLMGIFDVNMPTLYGEGEKAFLRLQLEIIKDSSDKSILAWSRGPLKTWNMADPRFTNQEELFARSPAAFRYCHGLKCNVDQRFASDPPFSISNKGLHISLPVFNAYINVGECVRLAGLDCSFADGRHIFIVLRSPPSADCKHCIRFSSNVFVLDNNAGYLEAVALANTKELYIALNRDHRPNNEYTPRDYTKEYIKQVLSRKYTIADAAYQ